MALKTNPFQVAIAAKPKQSGKRVKRTPELLFREPVKNSPPQHKNDTVKPKGKKK